MFSDFTEHCANIFAFKVCTNFLIAEKIFLVVYQGFLNLLKKRNRLFNSRLSIYFESFFSFLVNLCAN